MASYTVLTVFGGADAMNEPVMSLPLAGRASFRQIGILVGAAVLLPLAVYSAASDHILAIWPEPAFVIGAPGAGYADVTWDVVASLAPVPPALALGLPRPRLMPMDALAAALLAFAVRRASVGPADLPRPQRAPRRAGRPAGRRKSAYAGFAEPARLGRPRRARRQAPVPVVVSELGAPKSLTVTLHDLDGSPMGGRHARAYLDGAPLCSMTTDRDGVMGITISPASAGPKRLRITVDGADEPALDAILDVRVAGRAAPGP